MGLLDGKSALVVGASSGAGYGIAMEGADVVAAARRAERLDRLVAEAAERGYSGRIVARTCDVALEEDLDSVVSETVAAFGGVDILACIAQGAQELHASIDETGAADAVQAYQTGPLYTMLLMQKAHPYMKARGYGRIIICASTAAVGNTPGVTGYAMAKAAIMTLTRKAAKEWGREGIVTNCLLPIVRNDQERQDPVSVAARVSILENSPVGYLGDPFEDLGPVVAFLASEQARYLNGQMIAVDGGLTPIA